MDLEAKLQEDRSQKNWHPPQHLVTESPRSDDRDLQLEPRESNSSALTVTKPIQKDDSQRGQRNKQTESVDLTSSQRKLIQMVVVTNEVKEDSLV